MTVYFQNDGNLDMDVIRVMGVSVKTGNNPIGYFGTGLKFAVATLLRTGHSVEIETGGLTYNLTTRKGCVRGEEFDFVYLNDERLSFTTQLGRNWAVWQAYRELRSNAEDESGTTSFVRGKCDTTISVAGDKIDDVHENAGEVFISTKPLCKTASLEIHQGASANLFLKGIRAAVAPKPAALTYNITKNLELSEDRQIKSYHLAELTLEAEIPTISDANLLHRIISQPRDTLEGSLNFQYCGNPSPEFFEAAARSYTNLNTNPSARAMLEAHRKTDAVFQASDLLSYEEDRIQSAIELTRKVGCNINRTDFHVVDTLGQSVFGVYRDRSGEILISRSAIDMGDLFLAATIYEEWLHKTHRLRDCTREMQNFLFQRLMSVCGQPAQRASA